MLSLLSKNQISSESSMQMLSGIIYSAYHKEKTIEKDLYASSRSSDSFLKILQVLFFIPFYSIRQTMKLLFHPRIACLYKFEIYVVRL